MIERFERISDEQARALWQRAAQLQATAERNAQRALPGEATGLPDAHKVDTDRWTSRWLKALLREPDAMELVHTVDAPPAAVLGALRAVAARPSFDLMAESTVGEDPLNGAVLVYRVANDTSSFQEELNWSDVRVLLFTIHAEGEHTVLRARVPLYRRGINLLLTGASASMLGTVGIKIGTALGGALPAVISGTGALAMLPAAIGGIAGVALGIGAYRAFYRWCYRGGRAGINQLLQAIATEAKLAEREAVKAR